MLKRFILCAMCLIMILSVSACGGGTTGGGGTAGTTLTWYMMTSEPTGWPAVQAEVNKYLAEKLDVNLDAKFVGSDYESKAQMILSSGEAFDMMFTCSWVNNYESNVLKGAFMDITSLLDNTPKLKALYSAEQWDAVKMNNKIYGVPNMQALYDQRGLWFLKSIVDKYNLPVTEVKSLDDLTKIYQQVKDSDEGKAGLIPVKDGRIDNFIPIVTTAANGYVSIVDGKATDRRAELLPTWYLMNDWYNKGFFPADVATLQDETPLIKAQKLFSEYCRMLPGIEEKSKLSYNYDVTCVATGEPLISRNSIQSCMTAIGVNSKNPEKALQLIELMQTDPYLFNLMAYGLEGANWNRDPADPNKIVRNTGTDAYIIPEWCIGNQLLAYISNPYDINVWKDTEAENKIAPVDPNIGFAFNPVPVEAEVAMVATVDNEYNKIIQNGLENPDTYLPTYDNKMEQAGKSKVIAEVQKQYDAWKATVNQ